MPCSRSCRRLCPPTSKGAPQSRQVTEESRGAVPSTVTVSWSQGPLRSRPPALAMQVGALWSSRTKRRVPGQASPAGVAALAAALACPADPPAGGAAFPAAMFFALPTCAVGRRTALPAAMFFAVPARRARRRALAGFQPVRLAASSAAMTCSAGCCYRVHPRLAGVLDYFNAGRRRRPPPSRRGCALVSPCAGMGVGFSPRGRANSTQAGGTGLLPPEALQDPNLSSRCP